jgi:hypothetical protein
MFYPDTTNHLPADRFNALRVYGDLFGEGCFSYRSLFCGKNNDLFHKFLPL